MHWPPELIVGGAKKNRSGLFTKAKALQSIIQLMEPNNMYNYHSNELKVQSIGWSLEKAKIVLETWQRKSAQTVYRIMGVDSPHLASRPIQSDIDDYEPSPVLNEASKYSISVFTSTLLSDIMMNFSAFSIFKITVAYGTVSLYVLLTSLLSSDGASTHLFLKISGLLVIGLSIAAGLGICSLLRLPFNSVSSQILPFMSMGQGIGGLFFLVNSYSQNLRYGHQMNQVIGECLRQSGPRIVVTLLCSLGALGAALIIPIPALRLFVIQLAVLATLTSMSLLLLFPAIATFDLKHILNSRVSPFCCSKSPESQTEHRDSQNEPLNNCNIKAISPSIKESHQHLQEQSSGFKSPK